jgi:hypothetical protein
VQVAGVVIPRVVEVVAGDRCVGIDRLGDGEVELVAVGLAVGCGSLA